jgi:hypothetical protein
MANKVSKSDIDALLHCKVNKESVASALSKKAAKVNVEQIAKEVADVVVCLDAGLKAISDSVNSKIAELNLKIQDDLSKQIMHQAEKH